MRERMSAVSSPPVVPPQKGREEYVKGICTSRGYRMLLDTLKVPVCTTLFTAVYARVAFARCAIVNAALLVLAPTVTTLLESRNGGDAVTVVY